MEEQEDENTSSTTTSSQGRSEALERVEDTRREGRGLNLQRSKTRAAAGTVKSLLTKFSKENSDVVGEDSEEILQGQPKESETDIVRRSNQSSKYQSRASIKAAPGTVRNLLANFEKK